MNLLKSSRLPLTTQGEQAGDKKEQIIQQIKSGDYLIHVFIEAAKQLKISETQDVVCNIQIPRLDLNHYTSSKEDCSNDSLVSWQEHAFLEVNGANQEDLQNSMIHLNIQEKSMFSKNKLIGQYEFSLESIYQRPDHAILHQWVALTNNSEGSLDASEITGYLKLSIQVTGPNDTAIKISEEQFSDNDNILMPAHVQLKYLQINIRIFMAQDLPVMQTGGFLQYTMITGSKNSMDGYIKLKMGNKEMKTKVVTLGDQQKTIEWDQQFSIPLQLPITQETIKLEVWDKNIPDQTTGITTGVDTIIGSIPLKISQIRRDFYKDLSWINIYGAPVTNSNPETILMNSNPEFASRWKGRLLIQIDHEESREARQVLKDIEKERVEEAQQFVKPVKYQLCLDIGQGISLPAPQKYKIRMQITDKIITSVDAKNDPKSGQGGYNFWNQRIIETFDLPYDHIGGIGSIFIYLVDRNDKPISYIKMKSTDFKEPFPKWNFYQFTVDSSVDAIKDKRNGGIIQLRAYLRHLDEGTEIKPIDEFMLEKKMPSRPVAKKIRAFIYQCKDLTAADDDGLADPLVKVWSKENNVAKTKTVENSLSPIFYEVRDFVVDIFVPKEQEKNPEALINHCPPIIFDIYDVDKKGYLGSTETFMTRSTLFLKDASCYYIQKKKIVYQTEFAKKNKNESDANMQQLMASLKEEERFGSWENVNQVPENEEQQPPNPKWHPCKASPSSPEDGQILVSFMMVECDYGFQYEAPLVRLSNYITTNWVTFEIQVLGLRDLQSIGILPVKKATISFNFKNLLPNDTDIVHIEDMFTDPGPSGANPTINTLIKQKMPLPVDRILCPDLYCVVHDNIFVGKMQPTIGSFKIPLGPVLFDKNAQYQADIDDLKKLLKQLKGFMQHDTIPDYQHENADSLRSSLVSEEETDLENQKQILQKLKKKVSKKVDVDSERLLTQEKESEDVSGFDSIIKTCKHVEFEHIEEMYDKTLTPEQREVIKEYEHIIQAKLNGGFADVNHEIVIKEMIAKDEKLVEVTAKMDQAILFQKQKTMDKKEQVLRNARQIAMADFSRKDKRYVQRLIEPEYTHDTRLKCDVECNQPPSELYVELGFGEGKHYRVFHDLPLEEVKEVMSYQPFEHYNIKRGNVREKNDYSLFSMFGMPQGSKKEAIQANRSMGYVKGITNVFLESSREQQQEEKQEICRKIFEEIMHLRKVMKIYDENDGFSMAMISSQEGRQKLRQCCLKLGIGHLEITKKLMNIESENFLKRQLLIKQKCFINLYIIDAYNLASRDINSPSDPYILATLGKQVVSQRDQYQEDEENPDFYTMIRFNSEFPGCSVLEIKIMDYDSLFGDNLIGRTTIDLEDRFYSHQWQAVIYKPIETRALTHPTSIRPQGFLRLWVDIIPENLKNAKSSEWDITPEPAQHIEVRVCIFNTQDIPPMDSEGTSDVFFKAFMDPSTTLETDTHFRCFGGRASFNYRLKLPYINKKNANKKLTIQCYDRDLILSNDFIGQREIDLSQAIDDCLISKKSQTISKKYHDWYLKKFQTWKELNVAFQDKFTFWVDIFDKKSKQRTGKVRMQIEVLNKEDADKNPVGLGRKEPNQNPFLPAPEGRMEFSMNPRKMLTQLIGPEIIHRVTTYFGCFVCLCLTLYLLPNILSELFVKLIV